MGLLNLLRHKQYLRRIGQGQDGIQYRPDLSPPVQKAVYFKEDNCRPDVPIILNLQVGMDTTQENVIWFSVCLMTCCVCKLWTIKILVALWTRPLCDVHGVVEQPPYVLETADRWSFLQVKVQESTVQILHKIVSLVYLAFTESILYTSKSVHVKITEVQEYIEQILCKFSDIKITGHLPWMLFYMPSMLLL